MSKILIEKDATEYYDVDGPIIACVGVMAAIAMFKLKTLEDGRSEWELLPDTSPQFDYFHQGIYRNQRAILLELPEIKIFPDLQSQLCVTADPKQDCYFKKDFAQASDYKTVASFLRKQRNDEYLVYAVLVEDLYETLHGDGCFRYLNAVFFEVNDAKQSIYEIDMDKNFQGILRTIKLVLGNEVIVLSFPDREIFDRFTVKDILSRIQEQLEI